ncbi:MAG: OmpA family protein [Lacibacter sp.]
MKPTRILTVLALFISIAVQAQKNPAKKRGTLSFNINLTDYTFPAEIKATSVSKAFQKGDWYKPGNKSFGLGVSYWKGLAKKIDFSGTLTGTFANFPAGFVKDDSIGQAKFSTQLDALLHLKAFSDKAAVNPFLTAGIGAGHFPEQFAVYAPLGAGLQFHFNAGAYFTLQAQWRNKLTSGINNNYLFYSISFRQTNLFGKKKQETVVNDVKPVPKPDKDKDGFEDAVDQCPSQWGTVKGCPDTDRDGVPDKDDQCPNSKGTAQGCPDKDADGVADKDDKCPDEKGTAQGCPDSDKDGVPDKDDACKTVAGIAKYKGCPVPDTDKDGINDEEDKCPTIAGTAANKGCPEIKQEVKTKIDFAARNIFFAFASDEILKKSYTSLNEIVKILKENPAMKLTVSAHADNRGTPERNMMWSEKRAKAVSDYFISKGISADRIMYKGYGDTQPIADNNTEKGRAQNRRVELNISY